MITLKDIKVSKNRIPVQNAIWLRPVGGLSFKIYYPHGGDWTEIIADGSSVPVPIDVEERLKSLEKSVSELVKYDARLSQRVDNLLEEVIANKKNFTVKTNQLELSIKRLYGSVEITSLLFTKEFPEVQEPERIVDPSKYGVDDIYLQAIGDRTPSTATFAGGPLYIVRYESNSWISRGIHIAQNILDAFREDDTRIFTSRWFSRITGGYPQQVESYYAQSMIYGKTNSTLVLSNFDRCSLYDENNKVLPTSIFPSSEQLNSWGLTIDTIRALANAENGMVFIGNEALPYSLESESEAKDNWESYEIVLSCNDIYYNAKKVIRITAEVIDSEFGEVEIEYNEESPQVED